MDLLREVQERVRPTYHLFGHIHEGKVAQFKIQEKLVNWNLVNRDSRSN